MKAFDLCFFVDVVAKDVILLGKVCIDYHSLGDDNFLIHTVLYVMVNCTDPISLKLDYYSTPANNKQDWELLTTFLSQF